MFIDAFWQYSELDTTQYSVQHILMSFVVIALFIWWCKSCNTDQMCFLWINVYYYNKQKIHQNKAWPFYQQERLGSFWKKKYSKFWRNNKKFQSIEYGAIFSPITQQGRFSNKNIDFGCCWNEKKNISSNIHEIQGSIPRIKLSVSNTTTCQDIFRIRMLYQTR